MCLLGCFARSLRPCASVCFGTASVLQALAARAATPGTGSGVDPALLLRALHEWRYIAGLGLDSVEFVLQVVALRTIPIYAVGTAVAASLAITAVVAVRLLGVRLSAREWGAVALVCAGLALLALSSSAEGDGVGPAVLPYVMLGVALSVLVVGGAAGRLAGSVRAVTLGLGAGVGFGVVEVSVRLVSDPAPARLVMDPAFYALLVGGGAAFLLLTSASQSGSVTTATAGMVIGETIGPALVRVVWLGDGTGEGMGWPAVVGFAVAVAGALAPTRFGEAPTSIPAPTSAAGPASASAPTFPASASAPTSASASARSPAATPTAERDAAPTAQTEGRSERPAADDHPRDPDRPDD
ncbi:Multidrug transporter EmrE [Streptomyces sp. AmelKG-E11A]|nr:Multidrug transporter EmrE [Streptomyces sp. AmelKG-E11A]